MRRGLSQRTLSFICDHGVVNFVGRTMQEFGPRMHPGGWNHPWLWLLLLLMVAAAIAVLIWALLRGSHAGYRPMPPPGPPSDPAIETLRMRFARGEIDSDEYAARAAQLSGFVPPTSQSPTAPPPP